MNKQTRTYLIHGGLFFLTLVTTTLAGAEWMFGGLFLPFDGVPQLGWPQFWAGLNYSIPFLAILTVHEFGHYFVAKANHVRVTLPFYIPVWLGLGQSIGTFGAFIRIKDVINSRRKYFDIGLAGPLAGFVLALGVLWYGFTHLPPPEYIFTIHPDYRKYGLNYAEHVYKNLPEGSAIALGDNLLFWFFRTHVADPARLPHPYEITHYPYLLAGYLALFFTSLNLIPIGQLDGGHILYALIGRKTFRWIAPTLFIAFAFYAGLGLFRMEDFAVGRGIADKLSNPVFLDQLGKLGLYAFFLYLVFYRINETVITAVLIALSVIVGQFLLVYLIPAAKGYRGFLFFVFILGRVLGVYHPETELEEPLDTKRQILGWLALIILIISFSPKPFLIS